MPWIFPRPHLTYLRCCLWSWLVYSLCSSRLRSTSPSLPSEPLLLHRFNSWKSSPSCMLFSLQRTFANYRYIVWLFPGNHKASRHCLLVRWRVLDRRQLNSSNFFWLLCIVLLVAHYIWNKILFPAHNVTWCLCVHTRNILWDTLCTFLYRDP